MQNEMIVEKPWMWREALYKSDLPASALRVGLALVEKFLNRKTGKIFPSLEAIAAECRMPVETVRKGLKALKEFGMISTRKSGFNSSLDYFLNAATLVSKEAKGVLAKWSNQTSRSGQNRPVEVGQIDHLTLEGNLSIEPDGRCASGSPPLSPAVTCSSIPSESQKEASVVALPKSEDEYEDWIRKNVKDRSLHRRAIHLLWKGGGEEELLRMVG